VYVGVNSQMSYSVISGDPTGQFKMESNNGWLLVSTALDREITSLYRLTVQASDSALDPRQRLFSTATVSRPRTNGI